MRRLLTTDQRAMLNRRIESIALRGDGTTIPVELTMQRITDTDPPLFTGFLRDISERKESEARILRLNRLYRTLSHTSALIVRAGDRDTLFRGICRIAREHGFLMPWVGLIDPATGVARARGARRGRTARAAADVDPRRCSRGRGTARHRDARGAHRHLQRHPQRSGVGARPPALSALRHALARGAAADDVGQGRRHLQHRIVGRGVFRRRHRAAPARDGERALVRARAHRARERARPRAVGAAGKRRALQAARREHSADILADRPVGGDGAVREPGERAADRPRGREPVRALRRVDRVDPPRRPRARARRPARRRRGRHVRRGVSGRRARRARRAGSTIALSRSATRTAP